MRTPVPVCHALRLLRVCADQTSTHAFCVYYNVPGISPVDVVLSAVVEVLGWLVMPGLCWADGAAGTGRMSGL